MAHDDDAAGDLAFAVELGDAAAHLGPELDARHVLEHHRRAGGGGGERDGGEVLEAREIAAHAHHVLGLAQLDHRAAGLAVGALHRLDHAPVRDAVGAQALGVEHDLVLAHHAAHRGDLGDVGDRLELVAQEPVLQRAQLAQVVAPAAVDQRVLVDPAHAGGVRPERGPRRGRQARLRLVQVFQHPRARPIGVGAVLEQHVDERVAEHRVPAHRARAGHRHHGGGERIGELVLDDLRRLPRKRRADDDLHVGQVRQRVERRAQQRHRAPAGREQRGHQHEKAVGDRPADQRRGHFPRSGAICRMT